MHNISAMYNFRAYVHVGIVLHAHMYVMFPNIVTNKLYIIIYFI